MKAPLRHTKSRLRTLFGKHGFHPRNRLGQNFLVDLNLIDFIVRAAEVTEDDLVFEVGTGTGSLTAALSERGGAVCSVEVDPKLYELAREHLDGFANVVLFHADVLKSKHRLNPKVIEHLASEVRASGRTLKVVANLPYYLSTPFIGNLLASELPVRVMVLTLQKEAADRLVAVPGTKAYGQLSVAAQAAGEVQVLRTLSPGLFWPRPEVTSAVVKITPVPDQARRVGDWDTFRSVAAALFSARRKTLHKALAGTRKSVLGRAAADRILGDLGIAPDTRPDHLTVEEFIRLAEAVGKATSHSQ